ncbi:hypothetical protein PPERSA_12989 [Pseudocohnilembus persalinus]|uniref:Uncharacterized protein n=1 Tax=Pseudocohnilembus persalinus TaxID=266149 RepID=A0A0V0R1W7_PSEPJ|nr:hypothetical protein PPERSA_12989 [Pseudocohnilembus persalinus]|eukprot:KRX08508.1 hypothetical protein PPERSA_12989 [Pseudocohnilembus persalinus]
MKIMNKKLNKSLKKISQNKKILANKKDGQILKKVEKQAKKTKGTTRLTKEQVLQFINKEKEHLKTFIVQLQEVSQNIKELDYNDLKYNIMDNQKYIETAIEILEKEIKPIQTLKNYDINDKLDEIQRINQKYDILRQLIEHEASEENMKVYKRLQNIIQQILEKFLEFKQIVNSPFEKIKKPYSTKPTMSEIFSANKSNAGPQKTEKKTICQRRCQKQNNFDIRQRCEIRLIK